MRRLVLVALCAGPLLAQTPIRLPNGLNAVLIEQHESPLLRIEVRVPIAATDLPAGRPGLPELFLRVMRAGSAGRRNPEAFTAALEQNGLRLDARVDHGGLRLSMLARSSDQELAFGLLADLLLRNTLEHGPLEAQRQRLFQDTALRGAEALERARLRAEGGPEAPTTDQSLASFALADLTAFRARLLRPERVRLAMAGDLTPAQARQLLLLNLGAWSPEAPPAEATTVATPPVVRPPQVLASPAPHLQPLLDPLLRAALPGLKGQGLPGDPWILPAPFAPTRAAALARLPQAADLARARSAWEATLTLRALDPEARLREALDPGPAAETVRAVTLTQLQAAWRELLAP